MKAKNDALVHAKPKDCSTRLSQNDNMIHENHKQSISYCLLFLSSRSTHSKATLLQMPFSILCPTHNCIKEARRGLWWQAARSTRVRSTRVGSAARTFGLVPITRAMCACTPELSRTRAVHAGSPSPAGITSTSTAAPSTPMSLCTSAACVITPIGPAMSSNCTQMTHMGQIVAQPP